MRKKSNGGRLAATLVVLLAIGCSADVALSPEGTQVQIIQRGRKTQAEVDRIRDGCEKVARNAKGDDRNELINMAPQHGADTVIVTDGETYGPDWIVDYYRCGPGSKP